jgi:hypothetical protein
MEVMRAQTLVCRLKEFGVVSEAHTEPRGFTAATCFGLITHRVGVLDVKKKPLVCTIQLLGVK